MLKIHEETFQNGAAVPIDKRVEAFVAKAGPPQKVEAGIRVWFARDASGGCYEVKLPDSGTVEASKIFDPARADEACGRVPPK